MGKKPEFLNGPIVIGGIGGSGTRVLARILMELNYFIGNDLNESLDNLSYTLLFKRPKWYFINRNRRDLITRGLRVLEKSMTSTGPLSPAEHIFLLQASYDMYRNGQNISHYGTGKWAIDRYRKILYPGRYKADCLVGWGWKEPNSHLLLDCMNDFFPKFKYIHTIRHGLDMAFSQNQQQLFNWGGLYGIPAPAAQEKIPEASFRYWVAVHKQIMTKAAQLGSDKFLMVNFDKLYRESDKEIGKLLTFLEIPHDQIDLNLLSTIPKEPPSRERYRTKPTPWVTSDDIKLLEQLGFL
ncbi:MAG: sulfotransferase [Bacteroidales bacterium]|jgi:hypothetical protein|nr:sulfotransferase [Bacteroidales bacterium]